MSITANAGPLVVFGTASPTGGFAMDYNPVAGPSLFYAGAAILDPRAPFAYDPGQSAGAFTGGFLGFDNITTINGVPYTAATAAVVASANPTAATLALVSAASATTGVAIVPSVVRSDTGVIDTNGGAGFVSLDAYTSFTASITGGVMTVTANSTGPVVPGMTLLTTGGAVTAGAIGGTVTGILTGNGYVGTYSVSNTALIAASGTVTAATNSVAACALPFGSSGSINLWNPLALVGRCLSYTAAASATYATATASGYDVYGYPMVESATLTAGSTVNGKKAFKYVKSVVLSGGTADTTHAYSIGTLDIYGLPLKSDTFGDLLINYAASLTASTLVTAATGYVAADKTTPTATTGDVRGTYALQTAASTGVNRLTVKQAPQAYNIGSAQGLLGLTQFANF